MDGLSKALPHQGRLENAIKQLFSGENIYYNVRKEALILNPVTNACLELDVWIPSRNLSFEFQDVYHYVTTWESHVPLKIIRQRDHAKQVAVKKMGETMVVVPCWWDGQLQSLVDLIKFQRPELLSQYDSQLDPISLNPPFNYFPGNNVPDVGELMLASFPIALNFNISESISLENSWWMGEKYDGIRCCWHANDKRLYTRSGATMILSPSIIGHFPNSFFDMEVWIGRNSFSESQSLLFPNAGKHLLDRLRFVAFDDPNPDSHALPFEERYENILRSIIFNHPLIVVASRQLCSTRIHLEEFSNQAIQGGGEGVIMRKPKSNYIPGRSPLLVKLKASRGDDEALVVDVKGNSLTLQLPDETTFEVTNEEVAKTLRPKKGDVVSFTYENYTARSVPTKPQVYRIREDVTWQHVLREHSRKNSHHLAFNETSQKVVGSKPIGYWIAEKKKNMRLFFEKFARSLNLDPLLPASWYSMSPQIFLSTKGAHAIISYFKGSFKKAIMGLFPEIGLDPTLFPSPPANYWSDVGNRRKYFEKFASRKGFDPLVPGNWYSSSFDGENVPSTILQIYGGRVPALIQLFPEIGLDVRKFPLQPRGYWGFEENQRQFFMDLAEARGFDPHIPENWYDIGGDSSLSTFAHKARGGIAILEYYDKSFVKALVHLFPEMSFDMKKFRAPHLIRKSSVSKQDFARKIFDKFAEVHNFDPLVASNWHSVRHQQVSRIQGSTILMDYYNNIQSALMDAYPNIGLSLTSFDNLPRYHWMDMTNRRKLFVEFAKQNNFDPLIPTNWSSITFNRMSEVKGAMTVLRRYYNNNLRSALLESFPDVNWTFTKVFKPKLTKKQEYKNVA